MPVERSLRVETRYGGIAAASFEAMASPCELLLESADLSKVREIGERVAAEAWRVEAKFSRYRDDSVITRINRSRGARIEVDEETAALLDFAAECHRLSDGAFDVTSGILRRVWRFDGTGRFPTVAEIDALRPHIGFERLDWQRPWLRLPEGMEIDFGGIGKEYAVDRALALAVARLDCAMLVNFGGDLAANRAPEAGPWSVGVERPGTDRSARLLLDFTRGGLATSGDTHRYIEHEGERYGHILNVRTGYPVRGAPRSVTVAAGSCVAAGLLSTLAMLKGPDAETFLEGEGVRYWCLR